MASQPQLIKKSDELLTKIADRFDNLDYIDGNFTIENNIAADDMVALFKYTSAIIRGFLLLSDYDQMYVYFVGQGMTENMAQDIINGMRLTDAKAKLEKM